LLQALVTFLLEVQVVKDGLLSLGLGEGLEHNGHVKLAPTLLLDPERGLLEICMMVLVSIEGPFLGVWSRMVLRTLCCTLAKGLVKAISDFLEACSG
jgi:hypothetical protein